MPSTWDDYGRRRQRRRRRRPLQPRRRDLRRRQLPHRRRHAGRHLRRDLRLQPRRLVRRRGPRQRRLLRRRKSAAPASAPPASARRSRCSTAARPRPGATRSPPTTCAAFENAAARYELGKRGVWALAAVARLESNFGRGMSKKQLRNAGPLGLDPSEWSDLRGRRRRRRPASSRADPADSAATLARLIWSRGSLRAGIFTHNQAEWYVQAVLQQAEQIEGNCKVSYVDWRAGAAGHRLRNRRPDRGPRPASFASAPQQRAGRRSRRRSPPPTRSPPPPTSGAAATAPGTPTATTARAPSASPSTAPACSTRRSPPARWRATANPAPAAGSRSTPTPTHTYAVIAGLRWDTVGDAPGTGPRWHVEPPYPEGFVVRHPTGY